MANIKDLMGSKPDLSAFAMPQIRMPDIPPNPLITTAEANLASEFHKRLVAWINEFDAALDQAHEVGVRLVTFGQTVVFHLRDISYWNPSLISFIGETDDGAPVELVQHVSQISILLMKLRRKKPEEPKRPIGFHTESAGAEKPADQPSPDGKV